MRRCDNDSLRNQAEAGSAAIRGWLALPLMVLQFAAPTSVAQPSNAPDPLMVLMQSQPPVVTTAPKQALAIFDPPVVRVGAEATYRLTLDAIQDSINLPEPLPSPSGLVVRPGARGQAFRQLGGTLLPLSAFNFHARSDQPGSYVMPAFTIQVYGQTVPVPAAQLEVVPVSVTPTQSIARLRLELPGTNLYAGQAVDVRVRQSATDQGTIQGLTQVELHGDGILVDRAFTQQRIEAGAGKGTNRASFIHDTTLIPLRAGKITITAQGFESGGLFGGPVIIPGELPGLRLVESDPVTITVSPLPKAGELPGFTGGIGHFTTDPPALATNVLRVGEPVRLTVTVRGQGNLGRLLRPAPKPTREWQVFAETSGAPLAEVRARGFVTFSYSLIPLTEAVRGTPELPFSYFDPARAAYVDLTIPSLRVLVNPGIQPADTQAQALAASENHGEAKELTLSELATSPGKTAGSLIPLALRGWFPLVQVTPAFGFIGLWLWDRRRRYLAAHPDILARRRARRSLRRVRRSLRVAVRRGDTAGVLRSGLEAMRVAAAPHFPAEPRALVATDILALLTDQERQNNTGQTVRQFFAAADAAQFGAYTAEGLTLPATSAEIELVLLRLEKLL